MATPKFDQYHIYLKGRVVMRKRSLFFDASAGGETRILK
jgi:hypothetical protein